MTRRILAITAALAVLCSVQVSASDPPGSLAYFSSAHLMTQSPPPANTLRTVCRKQIGQQQITLLKTGTKNVYVGIFSGTKINNAEQYLSLRLTFQDSQMKRPPAPFEWLYLIDRDGNGQFDYLIWPVGPGAFKPAGLDQLSENQKNELFLRSIEYVFEHAIDSNGDGSVDGLVLLHYDPVNKGWIDQRAVVRSSESNGKTDQSWFFRQDIDSPTGYPNRQGKGFSLLRMGAVPKEISGETLDGWTEILNWFNETAKAPCKLN